MAAGRAVAEGRPADLVVQHAGAEALEVYGQPDRLREVEAEAQGHGWPTRRTGTSVTILRAEDLDGEAPEGRRRPANLADVFVLLTGEEVT
jgi:lipooligosaccharide transport system ATP-binding protein